MVIRIAELSHGPGPSTVYNDILVADDHLVRAGDLLMSWSGSLGVHVWSRVEAIVNQHVFKVRPVRYPTWFVFAAIKALLPEFRGVAADKATTMGHINRGHLHDAMVMVPSREALAEMDARLASTWDRMVAAEVESHILATLRDALLPELLSGRLRVLDAQEQIEAGV